MFCCKAARAARSCSMKLAWRAPRDSASSPNAPVPAKASSTIASMHASCSAKRPCARMSNTASRARSLVGRTARPAGAMSARPRCLPAMMRIAALCRVAAHRFARAFAGTRPPSRFRFQLLLGGRRAWFRLVAELLVHHARRHFLERAARQVAELERAVSEADEPRHREAHMRHHLADLAIAPFAQRDRQPHVARMLLAFVDGMDRAVSDAVDRDTVLECFEPLGIDDAVDAHLVAPEPAIRRQLQAPRELAVIGQKQQAFGIEIEPADGNEARRALGQLVEDGLAAFLVAMRRDEPGGLVIAPKPRAVGCGQRLAVDGELGGVGNVDGGRGQFFAAQTYAAFGDPALGVAARAEAGARQDFRDALAFGLGSGLGHQPQAAMNAANSRLSPSLNPYSGCHCTPMQKRRRGSSMPSMTPSGAVASITM